MTEKQKNAGAPKGNRNAAKPDEKRRGKTIYINVTQEEKTMIVRQAKGESISDYGRRKFGLPV